MRKILTFLFALATSVGMMWAQGPWTSGDCTVTLSGGVITVSGSGAMADYHNTTPWDSYKSSITSIVIENGVTHVGNETFCVCENLVSVTIGNDVETIGEYAFNDCYKFTTLTLGNSIQSIGECAFMWSKELTELNLPASLETIGENAFLQCKKITTVTIPSSVTSIGSQAFFYCTALTSIYAEPTTPPTLGEGVFTNVPTSIPLYVPNGSVAAYTEAAQWNAFNIQGYDPAPAPANVCGDGLTWELSEGVLTISYDGEGTGEMYDFGYEYDENPVNVAPWKENKSAITTVIVGDGVKSIGNYAFNDLYENFTAVTIANSVERIGVFAFTNAKWVTEMTLPSALQTIDQECFAANFGITSITIPSGVTSIGSRAFSYCTALTSLTCEATTPPTLGSGVFKGIKNKQSIPLYVPSESVDAYEAASQWNDFNIQAIPSAPASNPHGECGAQGDNLLWEFNPSTGTLTITGSGAMPTIWDTPSSVSWHAYRADITSVSLPDGLTTIGGYAFYSCPGLTSVTIPENVTNIAISAFANCANLASVTLPNSVLSIGQSALALCPSMTSLTLGSGLSSIGTAAFSGCSGLESVTNYATTPQVLDSYAFYNVEISNCELYVPEESVAAYQAATTWKDFKNVQAIGPAPTPEPEPAGYTEVSSFEALQTALQAGKNVRLTANISCTSDITLNNDQKLILDGNGFALNGAGSHRAFYFGGDVTIVMKDLTINAFDLDAGGGAIRNYGTLVLDACTVSGNHTDGTNQGGGAIENGNNAKLYAKNTTFSGNYSSEIGGAINNYRGNLYLANCSFENNYTSSSSAYYGGAIGINNGNTNQVRIINCSFSENKYGTNAGASDLGIYSNPSEYTIAGCTGITIQPKSGSMTTYTYGTATLDYSDLNDIQFSYTYTNTPPTPEPAGDVNITPTVDPEHTTYYYSTFFDSQVKYLLPAGVEAYVAELNGDELILTKIAVAGQVIPADNAVIFKSTVNEFTLTLSEAVAVTFSATNSLQGTDVAIAKPEHCYVLSIENDKLGFYQYTASHLNPHKAYIEYTGSSAPRRMPFIFAEEQTTTGVESQELKAESVKVIENGQLIIIRDGVRYNAAGQVIE